LIFGRKIDARATAGNVGTFAVYFCAGEWWAGRGEPRCGWNCRAKPSTF